MASVNASREKLAQNVTDATAHARLIGFDNSGQACIWFGGYSFSVYDAAREWTEVSHFTSGPLAGVSDYDSQEARDLAEERMASEGFKVIR